MVKITVLKKLLLNELVKLYAKQEISECDLFSTGDEFVINSIDYIPEGFCSWAWADIQRDIAMIEFNATPEPQLKNINSIVSCCTEGLRPVIFKIEKL
jgi:uncharacterized repeat protein (TIGR04076 family)